MQLLLVYLLILNIVAAGVTIGDKLRAKRHGARVPEAVLLWLAALGGSPMMYLTMRLIRHKTRKPKFMVGIPVIFLFQIVLAVVVWRVFYA
jgi:uncharacterized membrane protein YsdA (DUF1294 family)